MGHLSSLKGNNQDFPDPLLNEFTLNRANAMRMALKFKLNVRTKRW